MADPETEARDERLRTGRRRISDTPSKLTKGWRTLIGIHVMQGLPTDSVTVESAGSMTQNRRSPQTACEDQRPAEHLPVQPEEGFV